MPFPKSPRVIYQKNPLTEVVCQFRFPTILRIGAEEPAEFQERIRREYPMYALQQPSVEMPPVPSELSAMLRHLQFPVPPGLSTHRFSAKDSLRSITLSQNFVAFTELRYSRWELFRPEMQKAVTALEEVYQPAFYTRIGLRYKDLIARHELGLDGAKWSDLLKSYIVGTLGAQEVADHMIRTQTQSVIELEEVPGARATMIHGLTKPRGRNEGCYLIDIDFAVEKAEGINEPFSVLDRFNQLGGYFFRWSITDTLHNAMEPITL